MKTASETTTIEKPKNLLVAYEGGGYDGCFWEPNLFFYDNKGAFHPFYATGRDGISERREAVALELIADVKAGNDPHSSMETLLIDLNNKDDIKRFEGAIAEDYVLNAVKQVNKIYKANDHKELLFFTCDICEDEIHEVGVGINAMNAGGVTLRNTGKVCVDCYSNHTCSYCGEFYPETSDFDGENYCPYCSYEENDGLCPECKGEDEDCFNCKDD